MVAPMRFATKRCSSGCTVRSLVATIYQLGLDFQATPAAFLLNSSAAGAKCVAQTTLCSCSGKSPAKEATPSGFIQTRPSATSLCENMSLGGNLSNRLCDVSSSSGASAAMYTSPTTRSSVPAAVMTDPPYECPTRIVGLL